MGQFDRKVYKSSPEAAVALQFALDRLSPSGGELKIGNGNFLLNEPIKVHDNTSVVGSGRATRLRVTAKNEEGIGIICKNSKGVEISELTLSAGDNVNANTGLIIDNSGELKIQNLASVGFSQYGLWLRNKSFLCEIINCSLAGNGKANLHFSDLAGHGPIGDYVPNLIAGCLIYGGGKGIEADKALCLNITGCVIFQTHDVGIHLRNGSNSVLINGCRVYQAGSDALLVEASHELNVTGNIFCWPVGHGIVIRKSAWGTITANNIIDVGSYNPGGPTLKLKFPDIKAEIASKNGVALTGVRGYQVSNNAIFNWASAPKMNCGIHEDRSCFKNIIAGNNINYFQQAAVLSEGKETAVSGNMGLGDAAYNKVQELDSRISVKEPFDKGYIHSFQPKLVQEFIDRLK